MFKYKNIWGDHKTYTYDIQKHQFIQYFKNLYNEEKLNVIKNQLILTNLFCITLTF